MKTITRLFLVGLIALGMTACSNEDEVKFEGQPESTVSVRVVPSSNGPVVRAIGDLNGNGILPAGLAAESAIKTLEVYLFHGETPDGYGIATGAAVTSVEGVPTHKGTRTMVVVANASIGAVANKAALLAKIKELPITPAEVTASGLIMTAEPVSLDLEAGLNQYGYAENALANNFALDTPLKLHRVNARVAIVSAGLGTLPADQLEFFDGLKDIEVAIFNVPQKTNLFGTALAINGDYLFGEAWPSALGSYTTGTANTAFLENTITFPITNAAAPYFYVNENTSGDVTQQMLIVLRAIPTKGGTAVTAPDLYTDANGFTYYPIWVNADKTGYTYVGDNVKDSKIRRNTQYNISLTINKIGYPDIDPPVAATLDVLIEVAPWLVVNQAVTW